MSTDVQFAPPHDAATTPLYIAHPADSSQIFLTLLRLTRQSAGPAGGTARSHLSNLIAPGVLRSLLSALHFRDEATVYHARRVAMLAVGIAKELGWEEQEVRVLEIASLLHDIGKLGIPDSILGKPGKLSPDESELVTRHHDVGVTLLQACRVHQSVIKIVAHAASVAHPDPEDPAQQEADVDQGARILTVADAYDSLSHEQVYRKQLPHHEVMAILLQESQHRLDRNVLSALRRWLEGGGMAVLNDQRQADLSIRASAPIDESTIGQASSLCHAFSYLYLLETLYDGYYLVDSDLRMVVCSRGVMSLLENPALAAGELWSRRLLSAVDQLGNPLPDSAYPLRKTLDSSQPHCGMLRIVTRANNRREIEVHAIPLVDQQGRLHGAAEILRDLNHSKQDPTLYKELRQAAAQDSLTGVANRGELETRAAELFADYKHGGSRDPFSVIFLDIDHFKKVNDTYKHATGDRVLVDLTRLLEDELYSDETVGRYGGEEFLVLCPGTDLEQAIKRAERLRRAVESAQLSEKQDLRITASFGVAQVTPQDTLETVVHRADQALFDAKRNGRNRTCFREPDAEAAQPTPDTPQAHRPRAYVHTARFIACQAADIIIVKLKGFVDDHAAKLLQVSSELVAMRLGVPSLFRRWGKNSETQPVEIIVSLGEEVRERRSATKRIAVEVTVNPVGRPRTEEDFQTRATRVVELLRSHLLAD
jgi:diguanylate cyclase (GGDEF)-like protein/putative nucleotidyltransferase with HDIG domain